TYRLYIFKEQGFNLMKQRFLLPKRGAHSTELSENCNNSFASPYSLPHCFALSRAAHSTEFFCFVKPLFSAPFLSPRLFALHQEGAHYIDPDTLVKDF
ncbi:hypothetical protein, partial [Sulfuricella sp. T08]|uniref:hypothetical protein n=1 Tax=Sulfuricella sp. T08 TaxID=1632857 RepID=UPI001ED9A63B